MKASPSLALLVMLVAFPPGAQHPVQFRATVVGVSVPVLVKSGGRPVLGLTPEDFQLTDGGVAQDVTAVDGATVPLDLTVVVQSSVPTIGTAVSTFEEEVEAIVRSTGPADRLRLVVAGVDPRESTRSQRSGTTRTLVEYGCTPVYDALALALMRRTEPNRQPVVVVVSVGEGNGSILATDAVTAIARRSNALLFAVSVEPNIGQTTFRTHVAHSVCPEPALDWSPSRRDRLKELDRIPSPFAQWRETWRDSKSRLVAIAELTGGREIRPTVLGRNTAGPIREALDEARASYVLRYTPTGVPETGWHPIAVTINRPGRYDLRARPGYER